METQSSASGSNNDNENIESANEDATATEKTKLRQEIERLKTIIKQHERNLQTHFKDIEDHVTNRFLQNLETPLTFSKILNVKAALENDLYRFAGFRCVKFRKNEYVFNFTSTREKQTDNTQAVQIFIKDGKIKLGKWVMPVSININDILSKTPIDKIKKLTAFIKNYKHNVDCYIARQEQFLSLKEHMSHMKHCTLQSDMGFKQISLELYGVHDSENDSYMNLIIHLLYRQDTARPYKVQVDSINGNKLNDDIKQRLKTYFKKFKMSDLQTAFDKILSENNSTVTWMQEDDTESPLELNDTNSSLSDENFIAQLQSEQKRSLRSSRKKRELKRKWRERLRQNTTTENTTLPEDSSDDNQETNHPNAKKARTKSPQRVLIKKKKTKKATSALKQKKINKNPIEITPFHKSKVKLKQTKLNFQTQAATTSNANQISSSELKLGNKPDSKRSKIPKLITSTPLHRKISNVPLSSTLEINDITRIESLLDYSNDSDELGNKTPEKKTPEKKAPEKKAPEKKTPEKKTSEKKASEKKTPEKKAPEKKTPEKKMPKKND
ncbi:PREDICTED: trigger factor-like [Trachymyrmex cornetzi]|uniref:Uncharacterized protein n=1 Tax=Trachymyrmex cornetzi TaxID=471704 RepID=A0A151J428_9HYME|nr:PREDICTED: trigger factor-like [Trachymyrmex cornetzi]KYN17163.1 hypothetical protein ALC57_10575 [Trachymyrmex cornetzi]